MTDSIVTPENTKKIAGWIGLGEQYCYIKIEKNNVFLCDVVGDIPNEECVEYNPITNTEQSYEVLLKLLGLYWKIEKFSNNYQATNRETGNSLAAETLELVIYKAALMEAEK